MDIKELLSTCRMVRVTPQLLETCDEFSCGNDDLDEFFSQDYLLFGKKLACKTNIKRAGTFPLHTRLMFFDLLQANGESL